jgi:hypothetical protein
MRPFFALLMAGVLSGSHAAPIPESAPPVPTQVSTTHSVPIAKPASIEEPTTCAWGSGQVDISTGTFNYWPCSWTAAPTSATFHMEYSSVDNDNVKISYGWCPSTCSTGYRDPSCAWGDEYTSDDNFDHVVGDWVGNTLFKQPVSCFQMLCNNWVDDCQMKINSVTVVP